jgi:discoidin domain receptor family member 2
MKFIFSVLNGASFLPFFAASTAPSEQAYIGLVTGVLAVLAILLGSAVVLVIRRTRKKDLLHTALKGPLPDKRATINMRDLRMSMSLTPISNGLMSNKSPTCNPSTLGKKNGIPGGPGGLYGHVMGEETDSETSSVYHEPFKLPNSKQEYGCLLKKDALSKSGEYTGELIFIFLIISSFVLISFCFRIIRINNNNNNEFSESALLCL